MNNEQQVGTSAFVGMTQHQPLTVFTTIPSEITVINHSVSLNIYTNTIYY